MHPEYLYNNDTEEIINRVRELALCDEPALRQYCVEVSCQTDTSSLHLTELYDVNEREVDATLHAFLQILRDLMQSLSSGTDIFRTENGQADFPLVCQAITHIEETRIHLMHRIDALSQMRRVVASSVAEANRALHFVTVAARSVPEESQAQYAESAQKINTARERMISLDRCVKEAQNAYMTFVEHHLPTFLRGVRDAADFNHAGAGLNRAALRILCSEVSLLIERM